MSDRAERLRELVSNIAAAYFSNTHVSPTEIGGVLDQIASRLGAIEDQAEVEPVRPGTSDPVRQLSEAEIRRSVSPDGVKSFEDGKVYKTLRRHLSALGLTPAQYRKKWGLPADYPMVAPNLSAMRSELARSRHLGKSMPPPLPPEPTPARARKPRDKHAAR